MDQIFHTDNAEFSKIIFNDLIVGKWDSLLVDLSVSTLVDELTDGFDGGISIGNPGLYNFEHLASRFSHADENAVVDLEQTEELKDLARLRCDFVDTRNRGIRVFLVASWSQLFCLPLDTHNEDKLGFRRDIVGSFLLAQAMKSNFLTLCVTVLLNVALGALEDDTTLLLSSLLDKTRSANHFYSVWKIASSIVSNDISPERWLTR